MMKKPRAAASLVVSANHTLTGLAIYLTPAGTWSTAIGEALVFAAQPEAEAALPAIIADSPAVAVDPYLVEVMQEDGRLVPVRWRERIRLEGPTVPPLTERPDLTRSSIA